MRVTWMFWMLCLGAGVQPCWSQQPAPPLDPTPLERPRALCTVDDKEPTVVLKALTDLLTKNGFTLRQANQNEGWIEASRPDAPGSDDSDRVLIWLERDLRRPQESLHVYFAYGRFLLVLSGKRDIFRVQVNEATAQKRVGPLKDTIVRYCLG